MTPKKFIVALFLLIFSGPAAEILSQESAIVFPPIPFNNAKQGRSVGRTLYGIASWYSETDPYINKHTANGDVFDDSKKTCASWEFDFGTLLKVTNLENGKSIICRVNDRGPAKRLHRVIDLTKAAFGLIAPLNSGLIKVSVEPL